MFSIYFDFSRFFFFVGRKARKAWKSFGFARGGLTLIIHLPDWVSICWFTLTCLLVCRRKHRSLWTFRLKRRLGWSSSSSDSINVCHRSILGVPDLHVNRLRKINSHIIHQLIQQTCLHFRRNFPLVKDRQKSLHVFILPQLRHHFSSISLRLLGRPIIEMINNIHLRLTSAHVLLVLICFIICFEIQIEVSYPIQKLIT